MHLLCSGSVCEIFDFLSLFSNDGTDHGGWHKNPKKRQMLYVRSVLGKYWSSAFFGEVYKFPKKTETNISPAFPDSIAHLYRQNVHSAKTKTLLLSCHFHRHSANIWSDNKVSALCQNVSYSISFQEHKSVKSIHDQSILVVYIAKYRLLREQVRILLSTMDQFSHTIKQTLFHYLAAQYRQHIKPYKIMYLTHEEMFGVCQLNGT